MVRVTVVGGGVVGIGTAVALTRRVPQCRVTVVSNEFTPDTTGDGAAGLWEPYLIHGTPDHKVKQWGQETYNLFKDWWNSGEYWGISELFGVRLDRQPVPQDIWHDIPMLYETLTQEEIADYGRGRGHIGGCRHSSFTAECSKFLPKLMSEIKTRGGSLEKKTVNSLEEVAADADLIMNCSGLGARELVPDDAVYPCRGQVMRVRAPWVKQFFIDESEESFCYMIPNAETVVLGGTHQDGDWRREVDPKDTEAIWENCTAAMPSLKQCEVVREWVGLRPRRKGGIRIEADEIKVRNRTVPVVHNYGHGGSGVSTFWGCGNEAASIAADFIHKQYGPLSKL